MKSKILCLDDDPTMQALVEGALRDFDVVPASSIKEAEELLGRESFAAMVVDIQLPDGDGLRFLSKIYQSKESKGIPVLMLSSHSEISFKVMAFSFGAEDFLSKPFDPVELHARVAAKVRRYQLEAAEGEARSLGDLLLDFSRQKAFRLDGKKELDLGLTGIELKILSYLTRRLEQVYSRSQIMDHVWGDTFISDRTVDSHIAHLRQKLAGTKLQIETAKSFGYRAVLK